MNEEKLKESLEAALDVQTFDVLDYVEDQPVANDEVKVYTHIGNSRKLAQLLLERREILRQEEASQQKGKGSSLSIADEDKFTYLDEEINGLIEELDKTALTFKLQTVAPALIRAIEKEAQAKAKPEWSEEEAAQARQKVTANILSRAIVSVVRGDGAVDKEPWTAERLLKFEDKVYGEQAQQLVSALYDIVYTGQVFEEALTVDF